jgi:phosphoglycerate dehydrogenase-like enzyme
MKQTAVLVNTSRGAIIDESDLVKALSEKRFAGAALDVRATEPPGRDALCSMANVILMPHIAAFTRESQDRVVNCVCQDVASVLRGVAAKNFYNFPSPRIDQIAHLSNRVPS